MADIYSVSVTADMADRTNWSRSQLSSNQIARQNAAPNACSKREQTA
jgi:hypothetical protein